MVSCTVGFISLVERGANASSVAGLENFAKALRVGVVHHAGHHNVPVRKEDQRGVMPAPAIELTHLGPGSASVDGNGDSQSLGVVNDFGLHPRRSIGAARRDQTAVGRSEQRHLAGGLPLRDLRRRFPSPTFIRAERQIRLLVGGLDLRRFEPRVACFQ